MSLSQTELAIRSAENIREMIKNETAIELTGCSDQVAIAEMLESQMEKIRKVDDFIEIVRPYI